MDQFSVLFIRQMHRADNCYVVLLIFYAVVMIAGLLRGVCVCSG